MAPLKRTHINAIVVAACITILYQCLTNMRNILQFPAARTLISCSTPTPPGYDRSQAEWSGSAHCNDTSLVVEQAQLLRGTATGFDLALQCVTVPIAGSLADAVGRRSVVLWSCALLVLASLALYAATAALSPGLLLIGYILAGLGGQVQAMLNIQVADSIRHGPTRALVYGAQQGVSLLTTIALTVLTAQFVLEDNPTDYGPLFGLLFLLTMVFVLCVLLLWPETVVPAAVLQVRPDWRVRETPHKDGAALLPSEEHEDHAPTASPTALAGAEAAVPPETAAAALAAAGKGSSSSLLLCCRYGLWCAIARRAEVKHAAAPQGAATEGAAVLVSAGEQGEGEAGQGAEAPLRLPTSVPCAAKLCNPCRSPFTLWEHAFPWRIMCVMCTAVVGASAIINLQAWTVQRYGFSNALSTYVYGGIIVVLLLSFLASPLVLSCAGPGNTLTAGFATLVVGFALLAVSAPHPALGVSGAVVVAASGFCYPALQSLIASATLPAAQARVQSGLSSLVLVAAGVGAATHSALFAYAPLLGGVVSTAFALAVVCLSCSVLLLRLWALPVLPAQAEGGGPERGTGGVELAPLARAGV